MRDLLLAVLEMRANFLQLLFDIDHLRSLVEPVSVDDGFKAIIE